MKQLRGLDQLAALVAKGWVLRIQAQKPPGDPFAATLSSPLAPRLGQKGPFIYGHGGDTAGAALRALIGEGLSA